MQTLSGYLLRLKSSAHVYHVLVRMFTMSCDTVNSCRHTLSGYSKGQTMNCFGRKPNKKSPPRGKKGKTLESEELSEMKSKRPRQRGQPYPTLQQGRSVQPDNDVEIRPRQENDELWTPLQQEREEYERVKSECKEAKAKLDQRNDECGRLQAELDLEKAERRKSEAGLRKTIQACYDIQRKKDERKETEIINIRTELQNTKRKLRHTEADLSEAKCKLRREHNNGILLQKALNDKEQLGLEVIQLKNNNSNIQRELDEVSSLNNALQEHLQDKKHELDVAKDEITNKETELRRELDEEKNNDRRATEECIKMVQGHNQIEVSVEKVTQPRSDNGILLQKLQQESNGLEVKDSQNQRMEEMLRDKEAEIYQMKEILNAKNELLERESQRVRQTEKKLRQSEEERDREARLALEDKKDLTHKIDALQNELAARNEQIGHVKQIEAILQQKKREIVNLKASIGSENQHLRTLVERLQTQRDSLVTEKDSLKAQIDTLQKQYKDAKGVAESFQYRLSKEFSIRLASNETNMENISVKHRPAKIAEKFTQIESKEWVEAKEVLDEACDDERANIQLLLDIFECACQRARKVFDQFLSSEACRLHSPITSTKNGLPTEQHQNEGNCLNIPDSIQKEIMAFLKGACGECDIESLIQEVVAGMKEKHGEDIMASLQDTHVRSFVHACCRLAWQMAVQQPPLTTLTSNTQYDDRCHQLWYSSPPPSKSEGVSTGEIDFYIWPELRHSGTVLQKGRVCLKPCM